MAKKDEVIIGFEKQIWDAACVLWGHIPAAEYRKVIIGLIFLRFISNAFEKRYKELVADGDGFENDPDAYLEENIFFVPQEARWQTIADEAHKEEIGVTIDNAMRAIERDNLKLKPFDNCRVYDPCCGSGGMFVQSVKFIQAHSGNRNHISVYGQESNADTWKMAKMNMVIRGIDADFGTNQADTFFNDLHPTLKADFIMANPPFNYHPWGYDKLKDDVRWKYGLPPENNANFAWIQHMIHHLAPNGKIGLVLANGALSSQTGGEGKIRQKLVEADLIEGIVALPSQLFYSVTIPATLWFISKNKQQKDKTLFIDARNLGYMMDRKHRDFSDDDIKKISDTFVSFQNGTLEDVKGFCAVALTEDIAKQDYILTPGRYVGIEEKQEDDEPFDDKMQRLTSELAGMFEKSHELENKIRKNLKSIGYEI